MTLGFRPPPDYGSGGWGFESLARAEHTGQRSVKQEKQKTTVLAISVLRCQQATAAFTDVGQEAPGSQNVPLFG
jgi:hypothetical protein